MRIRLRQLASAADQRYKTRGYCRGVSFALNSHPAGTVEASLQALLPNEAEIAELERRMVEAASARGARATAKVLVRLSEVGDIILDAARADGAELIVMGTHGRTGVRRLLLGSVAEHVLRHADCPVVTVHAPGAR